MASLNDVDLSLKLKKEEYQERLEKAQQEILINQLEVFRRNIPVILVFEGWDAAGKGGAIKRSVAMLDPRGYIVHPISAPTPEALNHHYLWRFWNLLPGKGRIAFFDRSWYGRVLVERIEGFCTEAEWKRAYGEIKCFERLLTDDGALMMKFFVHISPEEQLERFEARQKHPLKAWKLTDEDWRNREKWDQYADATEDMLQKTDTDHAPWIVVPGNNKRYARVHIAESIAKLLKQWKDKKK